MSSKKRLDVLLVEKGLAPSREKAKAMIMAGIVYVNQQKEDKAGSVFLEDAAVEVRGQTLRYVSRGGLKLEKALACFPIDLRGRICVDIGASTGGFTDCMLQNGATKVYAIDVGYGQLDWKLREDPRVICMEKTNFRYVKPEDLDPAWVPDFASVDVSFISLSRILPPAREILAPGSEMVCLIKPQFEAGRDKVGKKGVVRDPGVHEEVIGNAVQTARQTGFEVLGLSWSPIRGPEGNIEYLMYLRCLPDAAQEEMDGSGAVRPSADKKTGSGVVRPSADKRTGSGTKLPAPEDMDRAGFAEGSPSQEEIRELVRASHEELDH